MSGAHVGGFEVAQQVLRRIHHIRLDSVEEDKSASFFHNTGSQWLNSIFRERAERWSSTSCPTTAELNGGCCAPCRLDSFSIL